MRGWGSAVVAFDGLTAPEELVAPLPLEQVYTRAERLRSGAGRTLQHWAGRLAAKHAVLRLLGVPATAEHLGGVEVLPLPSAMCTPGAACLHGHPPQVRLRAPLSADPGTRIRVSLSHTADLAVAVALAAATLPEDGL